MRNLKLFAASLAAVLLLSLASEADAQTWKLGVMIRRASGGGVEILQVFDGSPAQMIGLRRGDVIIALDGRLVNDPYYVRDYVLSETRNRVVLIYTDGYSFQEVQVEFGVVAAMVYDGTTYKEIKKPVIKSIQKKKVADPRRQR